MPHCAQAIPLEDTAFGDGAHMVLTAFWMQVPLLCVTMTLRVLQALEFHQQLLLLRPSVLPLNCQPPQLHSLLHSPHLHYLAQPPHLLKLSLRLVMHHHLGSPHPRLLSGSQLLQEAKQHQHLGSLQHLVQHQCPLWASQQQHQGSQMQASAALGLERLLLPLLVLL